eukprot:5737267-Alexandrium_andersonii.AAC.1
MSRSPPLPRRRREGAAGRLPGLLSDGGRLRRAPARVLGPPGDSGAHGYPDQGQNRVLAQSPGLCFNSFRARTRARGA